MSVLTAVGREYTCTSVIAIGVLKLICKASDNWFVSCYSESVQTDEECTRNGVCITIIIMMLSL